jgi:hypothetical protein
MDVPVNLFGPLCSFERRPTIHVALYSPPILYLLDFVSQLPESDYRSHDRARRIFSDRERWRPGPLQIGYKRRILSMLRQPTLGAIACCLKAF